MSPRRSRRLSSSSSPTVKQTPLRFPSRRAAPSPAGTSSKGKAPHAVKSPLAGSSAAATPNISGGESEEAKCTSSRPPTKKRKLDDGTSTAAESSRGKVFGSREGVENSSDPQPRPSSSGRPKELKPDDVRWKKQYAVAREKMGNLEPIHAKGQNKVHHILRVFDLSYEYGPCVGVSRLQRWERADALGLNPPFEVKEILLTKQALKEDEYKQSVFHDFEV